MTNKEKAFLIVEIMDLLDRWDKFREENKEEFQTDGAVTKTNTEIDFQVTSKSEAKLKQAKSGKRVLTIKEAAALVDGVGEYRIRQMCISGELPCFMAGKKRLINEEDLFKALKIVK